MVPFVRFPEYSGPYSVRDPKKDWNCDNLQGKVKQDVVLLEGLRRMNYSLNSLKGGYIGDNIGDYYRGY